MPIEGGYPLTFQDACMDKAGFQYKASNGCCNLEELNVDIRYSKHRY